MAIRRKRVVRTLAKVEKRDSPVMEAVKRGEFNAYCELMGMGSAAEQDVSAAKLLSERIPVFYRVGPPPIVTDVINSFGTPHPVIGNDRPTMLFNRKAKQLPAWIGSDNVIENYVDAIAGRKVDMEQRREGDWDTERYGGAAYSITFATLDDDIGLAVSRHPFQMWPTLNPHCRLLAIDPGYEQLATVIGVSPFLLRLVYLARQYLDFLRTHFDYNDLGTQYLDPVKWKD